MRTLLIDNYDSFTYNLFQLLAEVYGAEPLVLRNDEKERFACLRRDEFDALVISPGPGRPERDADFGISRLALRWAHTPLLGVCLGHQGLCHEQGARIERAPVPFHGRSSRVAHSGHPLFLEIPSPFHAVRYHSLVARDLPPTLDVIARSEDGLVMAVAHRERPHFGVQFHPESVLAEHGRQLLLNFRRMALAHGGRDAAPPARAARPVAGVRSPLPSPRYGLLARRIDAAAPPDLVQRVVFDDCPTLAWLDTSVVTPAARYSMLCYASPALGEVVESVVAERTVTVTRVGSDHVERHAGSLFDYLERELEQRRVSPGASPVPFALGYVGVLGYELKSSLGYAGPHRSELPDACLLFCDRGYVYDHESGTGWLLALHETSSRRPAEQWLEHCSAQLERAISRVANAASSGENTSTTVPPGPLSDVAWRHDVSDYRALIDRCQVAIREGESYELCLTNRLQLPFAQDPLGTYRVLRRENPAPYSAFLRLPRFSLLSSSPECFLRGDARGRVESRPIKGTARRSSNPGEDAALAQALRSSEKERSENLMIVDLVRNDLGRVCEVGSVQVPSLFAVESYATVHQLVSTVCGRLLPGVSVIDCVRACFPGGSMTGAPKRRTLEILDHLEQGPRGPYSGALGYFSLDGAFDLSIVIRTIVLSGGNASIGVGGAIVALSDPEAEIAEAELKAAALLRVLGLARQELVSDGAVPGRATRGHA
jgi:para-aminobenzoate synthetase